jgi:sugar lactone lactonase YvrE
MPTLRATATNSPSPTVGALQLLASGFGSPDDIVVAPNGDIYFGDFANNALNVLRSDATRPVAVATGLKEPEGIVVTQDGALIVAEQGANRLTEVDPRTGSKKVLRQLVNNTGKDGVDGLGLDPATGDVLVPDSPNGRLLRLSRDGSKLQTIAGGFVRPTGAAVEPGGSIVVADEFGNAVYRLSANGDRTLLAHIFQPDDVVVGADGTIYANSLKGEIVSIDPASGRVRVLASGLKLPHGLAVDPTGNLVIAEAGRNRILRLALHK